MAIDLRSYLAYRCFQTLKMEHDLRALYDLLWKEVENFELKEFFRGRSEVIEERMTHVESVLDKLDAAVGFPGQAARAQAVEAGPGVLALMAERGGHPVSQGMLQEHQVFMRLDPSPAVIEIHDLLEADRIEHLAVAAYDELIDLAEELKEPEVVALLKKNRREDEARRKHVKEWIRSLIREYREGKRRAA